MRDGVSLSLCNSVVKVLGRSEQSCRRQRSGIQGRAATFLQPGEDIPACLHCQQRSSNGVEGADVRSLWFGELFLGSPLRHTF